MLVELHMLKDYKTRVTGNYEILAGLMELMNRDADKVIALNAAADKEAESAGRASAEQREVSAGAGMGRADDAGVCFAATSTRGS